MRRITAVTALGLAALVLMGAKGCGSTSTSINNTPATTGSVNSQAAPPASPATTAAQVAHVGSTLAVNNGNGGDAQVTLQKIIDPAQGADQFSTPDSGKRFVGVELQIVNVGSGTLQGDANLDVKVVGSDNQTYTADSNNIAGCTNFSYGQYTLPAGQGSTGCVNFQVPTGVTVVQVNDQPGLVGGTAGQWKVP